MLKSRVEATFAGEQKKKYCAVDLEKLQRDILLYANRFSMFRRV